MICCDQTQPLGLSVLDVDNTKLFVSASSMGVQCHFTRDFLKMPTLVYETRTTRSQFLLVELSIKSEIISGSMIMPAKLPIFYLSYEIQGVQLRYLPIPGGAWG
ncbi:hypothetical protein Ocin01_19014 [Orchesella cincta]|uniref:Uncharacterized protein n=1 Tax=Orchesella cincta TaxID=48709 RepID=A0A1D2M3Z0_ORCCI|nr:hypothetical protein Ocin01_19014 [Orchesella cincta]